MQETIVVRNGKQLAIPVEKLVVGDVVEVKSGDRLPADIRIAHSAGFKVISQVHAMDSYEKTLLRGLGSRVANVLLI